MVPRWKWNPSSTTAESAKNALAGFQDFPGECWDSALGSASRLEERDHIAVRGLAARGSLPWKPRPFVLSPFHIRTERRPGKARSQGKGDLQRLPRPLRMLGLRPHHQGALWHLGGSDRGGPQGDVRRFGRQLAPLQLGSSGKRVSPRRRVRRFSSAHSSMGTAYLRDTPSASRKSATVNPSSMAAMAVRMRSASRGR